MSTTALLMNTVSVKHRLIFSNFKVSNVLVSAIFFYSGKNKTVETYM